ncbi:hypothetical protein H4K36_05080 [Streptomyces sp. DHE7-1]|nr:hypothetical protein [Streptomyces sp. DHE7-1]
MFARPAPGRRPVTAAVLLSLLAALSTSARAATADRGAAPPSGTPR